MSDISIEPNCRYGHGDLVKLDGRLRQQRQAHRQDDIATPGEQAHAGHLASFGKGNGTLLVL